MRKEKQGISLIVLVITIIIMIILAAAIIISLNNTGIIGAAENAVCKTNIKQAQNLAVLKWSELYIDGERDTAKIKQEIITEFNKNKLNADDYNIEVTTGGVEVSSKAGCTDSSGVEGGSSEQSSEWVYAYTYTEDNGWSQRIAKADVGSEATGAIVAKFYETGETLDNGKAYKMVVEGSGESEIELLSSYDEGKDTIYVYSAWLKDKEENTENDLSQNVTELVIGEGIKHIGSSVFKEFGNLKSLTIHSDVKSIGGNAFRDCIMLEDLNLSNGLTSVEGYVFAGCSALESVTIPRTITEFGSGMFSSCTNLKNVVIEEGITEIGKTAFRYCSSLESVTIPSTVTSLGSGAFNNCTNLKSIILPVALETIWDTCFRYCENLTTVYYRGTEAQWASINIMQADNSEFFNASVIYNYTGN